MLPTETLAQPFELEKEKPPVEPKNRPIDTTKKMLPIEEITKIHYSGEPIGRDENLKVPVTDEWILEQMQIIEDTEAYHARVRRTTIEDEDITFDIPVYVESMKAPETEDEAVEHYQEWLIKENDANAKRIASIKNNPEVKNIKTKLANAYERSWRSLVKGTTDYLNWIEERVDDELFEAIEYNVMLAGAAQWLLIADVNGNYYGREQGKGLVELKSAIFGTINKDLMVEAEEWTNEDDRYYRDPDEFWIDIGQTAIHTPEIIDMLETLYKGSAAEVISKRTIIAEGFGINETQAHQDVWKGLDVEIVGKHGNFPAEIKSVSGNLPVNESVTEIHKIGPGKFMVRKLNGDEQIVSGEELNTQYLVPKNMVSYASNRPNGPVGLSIRVPVDAIDPKKKDSEVRKDFQEALGIAVRNFDTELEKIGRS